MRIWKDRVLGNAFNKGMSKIHHAAAEDVPIALIELIDQNHWPIVTKNKDKRQQIAKTL